MKVPVHKILGDVCMTYKDGERLQREFREAFDRGETVELDFDRMRIYVTTFFNAAVASLLENYSRDELERRLKIVNLPPAAKELLDDSLDNADRVFAGRRHRMFTTIAKSMARNTVWTAGMSIITLPICQ